MDALGRRTVGHREPQQPPPLVEAKELRLINRTVRAEALMETAEATARMIAANSQSAIRSAKEGYSSLGDFSEPRERLSVFARIRLPRLTPSAARHRLPGMEGEVLKGHLDMIVLAVLAAGPAHGYAVIQEINRRSGGTFDLPEGTIYPVLHRLEKNGLLSSRWTIADSGRKRRTYTLTRRGRSALADQRAMWERFAGAISGLFGETYHAAVRARH